MLREGGGRLPPLGTVEAAGSQKESFPNFREGTFALMRSPLGRWHPFHLHNCT